MNEDYNRATVERSAMRPGTGTTMSTEETPAVIGFSEGLGMRVGVCYIVTRDSTDKEFQCGDRIWLCADGSIDNIDAHGWMSADDLPAATRGMIVAVDLVWLERQRDKLVAQMAYLHV